DLLENEGPGERRALARGEARHRLLEHGVEEVAEPRETERRLAFGRLSGEDREPCAFGCLDAEAPERRLPHARLALENESRCHVGNAGDEVPDGRELDVPPYDGSGQ